MGTFPHNMTRHKMKHNWLLYLSVISPLRRSLAIQSDQISQTFCCQFESVLGQIILIRRIFKNSNSQKLKLIDHILASQPRTGEPACMAAQLNSTTRYWATVTVMALFHCMVRHGTFHFWGFSTVHSTWY